MKNRKMKIVMLALGAMMAFGTPANAQFGKFLDKVGKAVDKASKAVDNAATVVDEVTGANLPQLTNPMQDVFAVELVGVYGRSTSENYGNVYAVLKVKMLKNQKSLLIGGKYGSTETQALDADGNIYKTVGSLAERYNMIEGNVVKVVLGEDLEFKDVPKKNATLPAIRYAVRCEDYKTDILTIANAPIQWDVQPE